MHFVALRRFSSIMAHCIISWRDTMFSDILLFCLHSVIHKNVCSLNNLTNFTQLNYKLFIFHIFSCLHLFVYFKFAFMIASQKFSWVISETENFHVLWFSWSGTYQRTLTRLNLMLLRVYFRLCSIFTGSCRNNKEEIKIKNKKSLDSSRSRHPIVKRRKWMTMFDK